MSEERPVPAVGARRRNPLAVTALVLGSASIVLGLFSVLGWVLGLVAIVVGALAIRRGAPSHGAAFWGIWLGVGGSALSMLVFALAVTRR